MSQPSKAEQFAGTADAAFAAVLARCVSRLVPDSRGVSVPTRLSGGASQETWAFDILAGEERRPAILRRLPEGHRTPGGSPGPAVEARLMELARSHRVPSPRVLGVLHPDDGLGEGFLMDRVEGETIPRKILRDAAFAEIRPRLAFELGTILARIHAMNGPALGLLRELGAHGAVDELYASYKADGWPRPVFDFAFRWLREQAPERPVTVTLVHGDFRNGNLIVGPEGVRAVLDWELAHLGDPMEDLGWLCVNSWRFGVIGKPVGGFGQLAELIGGYERAGGCKVDPRRVVFWQTLGTLRWGVFCLAMLERYESGEDRSVERAMIGRRASETELDLLRIIAPRA